VSRQRLRLVDSGLCLLTPSPSRKRLPSSTSEEQKCSLCVILSSPIPLLRSPPFAEAEVGGPRPVHSIDGNAKPVVTMELGKIVWIPSWHKMASEGRDTWSGPGLHVKQPAVEVALARVVGRQGDMSVYAALNSSSCSAFTSTWNDDILFVCG